MFEYLIDSFSGMPAWAKKRIREAKEKKLETLDLAFHEYGGDEFTFRLTNVPEEVFELSWLTSLNLSQNMLRKVPETIARLKNLTSLSLVGANMLDYKPPKLPEALTRLQNLTKLDLSRGGLQGSLPDVVTRIPNLTTLILERNDFRTLPNSLIKLKKLALLDISMNPLNSLPEVITQFKKLTELNLYKTQLSNLPESIAQLQNLETLELGGNSLRALPEGITQLKKLTYLSLSGNKLDTLPEGITQLRNLAELRLDGNPLITPPSEIAKQGIEAINNYFRQIRSDGVDYLYEAKLLILGEVGAGKTTFANKILNPDYKLRADEPSTRGVEILRWKFPLTVNDQFRVNIWDFGGQEIYHATHQFFLTRRSLYVLVADTRKEDTDFHYWLNAAALFSDNSPLLIIKNERQDRQQELNERLLRGQFENLKEILATNLATNRGLDEVKQEVQRYLQKLPHVGTPLPKTWVRVREQFHDETRHYISLDEYLSICETNGFSESEDALQLSNYLHDIGVFLHFQDEPLLNRIVILKPIWGTDAVYKVLDNKTVIENQGRFTRADLNSIWEISEYANLRDELLQLMMKFRLCYEIPTQRGNYIAPQLLPKNQPDYDWNDQDNLLLRFSYEFMPKGIITQLIVIMHSYIYEQRTVWKSGIVIEKDKTRAEVIEHYDKREIHVRVVGSQARDLLTIIRHEFRQIHDSYKGLKFDELVRCNCSSCSGSPEPYFYTVDKLLEMRANNQMEIQCQLKPYYMVNIMGLLGDVIDFKQLSEKKDNRVIYAEHYYEQGDNKMTENKIHIEHSTVHGSVVAAESIKGSFNIIQDSGIKNDLKEQLQQLVQAVAALAKELPKEKAEEAADDLKRLAEEVVKEKPNPKWYSVSIDGLIAAAQNIGKVGDEVIKLAEKVRKTLTGGI